MLKETEEIRLFVTFFLLMAFQLGGLGPPLGYANDCNFNAICDIKILCAFLLVCSRVHAQATLMVLLCMIMLCMRYCWEKLK